MRRDFKDAMITNGPWAGIFEGRQWVEGPTSHMDLIESSYTLGLVPFPVPSAH